MSTLTGALTQRRKVLWSLLPLTALIASLEIMRPWAFAVMEYQKEAIENGQFWRLLSAHFVHLTPWHMGMNLSGLAIIWICFLSRWTTRYFWYAVVIASLFISILFLVTDPSLLGYAGFSGVLHTLLVAGVIRAWRQDPWLNSTILITIVLRLSWEQSHWYNPDYLVSWIHGPVYPNAHLFGALAGCLLALRVDIPSKHKVK